MPLPVAILVVTYNCERDLPGAFAALAELRSPPAELVVVDCASADGSVAAARRSAPAGIPTTVEALGENLGFAGGMNRAIALSTAPYLLTLNADARLAPDSLAALVARLEDPQLSRVAAVTGRLVRELPGGAAESPHGAGAPPRLDACGMRLSWTWRHFDRGSGEPDRGQYDRVERVFGGTGAATLWSRAAVEDVALVPGEMFDPRFHTFREDAELCFRLCERGWAVVYEPAARALHRRRVLPARRRQLAALANLNSLRNRYLLRLYHQTFANFVATLPFTLARDLGALAWVLAVERPSLAAYGWLWRHRRELLARRRAIQARRTAPAGDLERWFRTRALPLAGER